MLGLISRRGIDYTEEYPELVEAARTLDARSVVIDGELVVLDRRGVSSFQALQQLGSDRRRLAYFAFDLVAVHGDDLTKLPLVDRKVYPEAEFPAGQWDYQFFYQESFDKARASFESNIRNVVKALFRKGNPDGIGKPSRTSAVRKAGGWLGGGPWPDLPRDADLLTETDLEAYVAALTRNGFFGPDSWYMNHKANGEFAKRASNGGRLTMPVLFLHGLHDYTCETVHSKLAEPMRRDCADLTEVVVPSGHWMAQEQPVAVNAALRLAKRAQRRWRRSATDTDAAESAINRHDSALFREITPSRQSGEAEPAANR